MMKISSKDEIFYIDENLISEKDFIKSFKTPEYEKYLHREDGPANIGPIGQWWYCYGKLHRIQGPAKDNFNCVNEYYLWGKEYSEEEYIEAMAFLEENGDVAFKMKYQL